MIGGAVGQRRFAMSVLAAFGAVALVLAIVGVYGVIAYSVTARRQEFGVRIALGAFPRQLVLTCSAMASVSRPIGLVIGIAAASLLTRFLSTLLFRSARSTSPRSRAEPSSSSPRHSPHAGFQREEPPESTPSSRCEWSDPVIPSADLHSDAGPSQRSDDCVCRTPAMRRLRGRPFRPGTRCAEVTVSLGGVTSRTGSPMVHTRRRRPVFQDPTGRRARVAGRVWRTVAVASSLLAARSCSVCSCLRCCRGDRHHERGGAAVCRHSAHTGTSRGAPAAVRGTRRPSRRTGDSARRAACAAGARAGAAANRRTTARRRVLRQLGRQLIRVAQSARIAARLGDLRVGISLA